MPANIQTQCRRFESKVAVVTGAAQGIGYATALRLGLEGGAVLVVDRAELAGADAVTALRAQGVRAEFACADLGNYAGAMSAFESAVAHFGSVDVLVNNVGGTVWKKPFWFYTEEEIRLEVERSFWPPLWCCRAAVEFMIRQGRGGAIVNVGSNATEGILRIPYAASKGGVVALTTALAVELADLGIRVNCVSPGATAVRDRRTQREPRELTAQEHQWNEEFFEYIRNDPVVFNRHSTVEEQAAVIAFLASDDASYVTGEVIDTGKRGTTLSRGARRPGQLP